MGLTENKWLEAQTAIIGAILIDPSVLPRVLAETESKDFDGVNRTIFDAASSLHAHSIPVDAVSIANKLGPAYREILLQLMKNCPSAASFDAWIPILKEQARLTAIREKAMQLADVLSLDDARQIIGDLSAASVEKSKRVTRSISDLYDLFYERHKTEKKADYLDWGLECINNYVFCEPGDFVIIAGYRSDGKSALALQTGISIARKKKVGLFSLETSDAKFADRLIAHICKINATTIKKNAMKEADWRKADAAAFNLAKINLSFEAAAGMSPEDILAASLSAGYEVIIIDYLQLIQPAKSVGSRYEDVTGISMALHTMAQKHGITVIALSQLARPDRMRLTGGKIADPQLHDLRESGQLEQDADIVLMIHRPRPADDPKEHILRIAKNKDGELRRFEINFDGGTQTFSRPGG